MTFSDSVETASHRPDVRAAVGNVYAALQDAIELRRPVCRASGQCCRFDEFGHRLFITTMEMATFVHDLRQNPTQSPVHRDRDSCPFQQGNLCGVHSIRPFGCRVFFCDEASTEWQQKLYARFHAEFKRLHEEMNVPYFYVEWRRALQALALAGWGL